MKENFLGRSEMGRLGAWIDGVWSKKDGRSWVGESGRREKKKKIYRGEGETVNQRESD